jgi:hypothetical protein
LPLILEGFQQFTRFTSISFLIEPLDFLMENYVRFVRAVVVIVKALYPLLLTITSKSRLSLHPFWMLGIRG